MDSDIDSETLCYNYCNGKNHYKSYVRLLGRTVSSKRKYSLDSTKYKRGSFLLCTVRAG